MSENKYGILDVRMAAAEAGADPRSVQKVLDGGEVRGIAGDRCQRAIAILKRKSKPARVA